MVIGEFEQAFEAREFNKALSTVFDLLSEVDWERWSIEHWFGINIHYIRPTSTLQTMNHGYLQKILARNSALIKSFTMRLNPVVLQVHYYSPWCLSRWMNYCHVLVWMRTNAHWNMLPHDRLTHVPWVQHHQYCFLAWKSEHLLYFRHQPYCYSFSLYTISHSLVSC